MAIDKKIIDELLKDYETPEDLIGKLGLSSFLLANFNPVPNDYHRAIHSQSNWHFADLNSPTCSPIFPQHYSILLFSKKAAKLRPISQALTHLFSVSKNPFTGLEPCACYPGYHRRFSRLQPPGL
jgi:hypothetical protein